MDSNNDLLCVYICCISITLFQQRAFNSIVMILGQLFELDVSVSSFSNETSTGAAGNRDALDNVGRGMKKDVV